ncbi:MAG TPA: hypothetical protein QGH10_10965, partial [Armatimonadota bacterium]|nr:hypothetical protein [Armatimonadota bacterium]
MKSPWQIAILVSVLASSTVSGQQGVLIEPAEDGTYTYVDDFATPKCLTDAFLSNTGVEVWAAGSLQSKGPARNRTLVYRFHGTRAITSARIAVQQRANGPNLGGRNLLYVSPNGLDWRVVADSKDQPGDPRPANRWQEEPFEVVAEEGDGIIGGTELWLKLVMDNYSALETYTSNFIQNLEVRLDLGDEPGASADPQAELRALWGEARERSGWTSIALDATDPEGRRAPHYYEDADGRVRAPGDSPHLDTREAESFRVHRTYLQDRRSPLSLVTFVGTGKARDHLMARITVRATRDASRRVRVTWDGREVARFDCASFFESEKVIFARLDGHQPGARELRVAPEDEGLVVVREVAVAGPRGVAWAAKPALPAGRPLEVLSAAYLPDPPPPAASQVVEGRHAKQQDGLVMAGLQAMHSEHGDFGALRIILRNPGRAPVQVGDEVRLNDEPIAESYVDFVKSEWDARGVVWHRMRPQLLGAGECAELYVRFRRRPAGESARVTIPCENAPTVSLEIPYDSPKAVIDYVTTDEEGELLYVYARATRDGAPGALASVALDGQALRETKVYGGDFAGGVVLVVARPTRRLEPMSFHAITVRLASGEVVGAQFRVLPWFFPRSSIHVPSALCEEMNMNLGMWHLRSEEECREHDLPTTTNTHRMFDAPEWVRYILGPDEPDAGDNRGGGYAQGLGSHARRLEESGWARLVENQAPHVATWLIMNGTTRPLNWCVYGQFADVCCFDPYPVNFYGADHAYVRESLSYARQSGMPRRMLACLEAFGWSAGQGVPSNRRGPLPEEWRQNVVQAIGSGAKGLTSWVYVAGAGGWQIDEAAREEMALVNALVEGIEDDLLLGVPVDWAETDAGTVMT